MNKTEEAVKLIKIASFLEKYDIKNATINKDFTVDVDGDANLSGIGLDKIPIQFGKVDGYFDCSYNNLTSLKGCPKKVCKSFYCHKNQLETLDGAPEYVADYFYCNNNQLTSLKGAPEYVGGNFYCEYNNLTSLVGCPQNFDGLFYCKNNPNLKSLKGICEYFGIFISSDFFNGHLKDYKGEL